MQLRPLVGVIACRRDVEGHPAHTVTDKYLSVLREYALEPVVLPVWDDIEAEAAKALLARLDGLLLTGSYSNVAPSRYGASRAPENTRDDSHRDAASLTWIPAALDLSVPLFGICRGFQELNVCFGGTLHQAVQNQPERLDHREPQGDMDIRYAPVHGVEIMPGGRLANLFSQSRAKVNSLHQQGIDRLGRGLISEALAEDGLIEAISVADVPSFALAVQWHPEWRPREHRLYDSLFRGFSDACRARLAQRAPSPVLS